MDCKKQYKVIGLMSGTSLDGVDIAYITFYFDKFWCYKLEVCQTIPYNNQWKNELKYLHLKSKDIIKKMNVIYGEYLAGLVEEFIKKNKLKVDLICSHGHTVLHQPDKGISIQIGDGKKIRNRLKIDVVSDFRKLDIQLGGQGAPLVPVGDELLFKKYDYCLNLGGFSNFSYSKNSKRLAHDICPVNIALNHFASELGRNYDKNGELSKSGFLNKQLLSNLNRLEYYKKKPPKSLSKEWLESNFIPEVNNINDTIENKLHTIVEHIAIQIGNCITKGSCLVTGGGAFNDFLIQRMKVHSNAKYILGNKKLIEFKEALIFGLLGVLKLENQINCFASVTGAKRDSIVGDHFM